MVAASILTAVLVSRRRRSRPATTIGRAMGAIWTAMGISSFLLLFSLGMSGRFEFHLFVAIIGALLGMANATSSIILKWRLQFGCAVVWWATAVIGCFGSETQISIAFLAAIFLCQIVFGIYGMISESRERRQEAVHA
jgi:hypothetical protein